jgi:hypothetical protein
MSGEEIEKMQSTFNRSGSGSPPRSRREPFVMTATVRSCILAFSLCATASPAAAQWTRVPEVPASSVFSLFANGDTIVAGTNNRVYVSTNAGATWQLSSQPAANVSAITAVRIRNRRLFAGTFGQGVFISDNLGATWQAFNQGLVGGILNTQLDLSDLQVRGDSLYAATSGAGVYVRSLRGAGTWSHFGEVFEPNQDSNVQALALGGTRLLAAAGSNGEVLRRDPGDAEWTISPLDNLGLHPGLQAASAAFTGGGWVVGTSVGLFRSVAGQEPWTFVNLGIGLLNHSAFATRGRILFAVFDLVNVALTEFSDDDGATWRLMDAQPNAFVFGLAMSCNDLYAGRADGLWRRSNSTVSVQGDGGPIRLRFALAEPKPVRDLVRLRFDLPASARASIEVFDAAGRRAAESVQGTWPAGSHEVTLNARGLGAGVYFARLTTGDTHEVVRLVHVR